MTQKIRPFVQKIADNIDKFELYGYDRLPVQMYNFKELQLLYDRKKEKVHCMRNNGTEEEIPLVSQEKELLSEKLREKFKVDVIEQEKLLAEKEAEFSREIEQLFEEEDA